MAPCDRCGGLSFAVQGKVLAGKLPAGNLHKRGCGQTNCLCAKLITAAFFAQCPSPHGFCRVFLGGKELAARLAPGAKSSPVTNQGEIAEKGGNDKELIIALHVALWLEFLQLHCIHTQSIAWRSGSGPTNVWNRFCGNDSRRLWVLDRAGG